MPAPRSVEIVTQSASGIVFAMLKVRRHAVSPSAVGAHPAMAFGATHEAPFVEAYCLLKRDHLPAPPVLSSQIGRPSMLAICDARHPFSSLSGYV